VEPAFLMNRPLIINMSFLCYNKPEVFAPLKQEIATRIRMKGTDHVEEDPELALTIIDREYE